MRALDGALLREAGDREAVAAQLECDRAVTEQLDLKQQFFDRIDAVRRPLARIVHLEWKEARLLIGGWREPYQEAVRRGEITLEESVNRYLASI